MDDVYSNMSTDIESATGQDIEVYRYGEEVSDSRFISFHNITYTVEKRVCFKKRPPKIILNDIRYCTIFYCDSVSNSYVKTKIDYA